MNFQQLRRLVSIEDVLRHRGLLDELRRRGQRWVGSCPVHGGDNPRAFVADSRNNLWKCFTACGGGDVVELVKALDGATYAEVNRTLRELAGGLEPKAAPPTPHPTTHFRPYTRRLTLDPHHPFLDSRGIRAQTARRFEVGAWHGRGMLAGCVAARLHDIQGRPLGYAGRRLNPTDRGKWVFPPLLPTRELLYGWHRADHHRHLVVVEGIWEVLRLHQLGMPAVALLGTRLSHDQCKRLRPVPHCTILLDGDSAGKAAATKIAQRLGAHSIELPDGCDPADLDDHRLRQVLKPPLLF